MSDKVILRPFSDYVLDSSFSPSIGERDRTGISVSGYTLKLTAQMRNDFEPKVFGGVKGDVRDYPGLFWYVASNRKCSASQIGPRVIITAAHCLVKVTKNDSDVIVVGVEFDDSNGQVVNIDAECTLHPEYKEGRDPNLFPDWALCLLQADRKIAKYEELYLENVNVGEVALIAGYGCLSVIDHNMVNNYLTLGEVEVAPPAPGSQEKYITLFGKRIASCQGDSGGPTYIYLNDIERVQVGVNSRSNYRRGISKTSGFSNAAFKQFLDTWVAAQNIVPIVCGRSVNLSNCRDL